MFEISGFSDLQQLHVSKRTHVYRAKRAKDNLDVIIKKLSSDYPSVKNIIRYKHEYELLQEIDADTVIRVHDLEKTHGSYILVLEDFRGVDLNKLFTNKIGLEFFLPLAIKIAQAIGDIHALNIIHKDINLSNIIYNEQTGQLKIIDFELSSTLSTETSSPVNPNILVGTLTYISPEQTGRMNREIDYRTDYYSLGVSFYKLLTGVLPFRSVDAMELIYSHIAKQCTPVCEVEPSVGQTVSDIVAKLMSKNAEDRYQSTAGLIADLKECLRQFESNGKIEPFPLAEQDFSGRFKLTQKLYGREAEVQKLLDVFDKTANGTTQLVLVNGYSGVGKTSLVREVQKPIVAKRGNFCSGKFDQLQKSIPYSALIQSLSEFVEYLLKEDADSIAIWKTKITQAVGFNAQVLVDVIPALSLIIGPQPPVEEVGPAEAQNRLNLVFSSFIRVVSQRKHPFVIFIDDLQWVDSASLNLIALLLTDSSIKHLLIIGSYRDNEVDQLHPLMNLLQEIKDLGIALHEINLGDLSSENVEELTSDALNCSRTQSSALAHLIYDKSHGNAFYLTQLLKSLPGENLLNYSTDDKCWQWDIDKINAKGISENVVGLMIRKIERLSSNAQQVLRLAACIGNVFDIHNLAVINERSQMNTMVYLWEAIKEDLVIPEDSNFQHVSSLDENAYTSKISFKFRHDRIQQAAYSLIPTENRKPIHLQIGRLLLNSLTKEEVDDDIFVIVNHLNHGKELIDNESEMVQLVKLNIKAGLKAKASAAYDSAVKFFREASSIPLVENWKRHHSLMYNLHIEQAECEYFVGNFDKSRVLLNRTLKYSKTPVEKGQVFIQLIAQHSIQGEFVESIHTGIEAFACFGIELPQLENLEAIGEYIKEQEKRYQEHWGSKPIEQLYDLPTTDDPVQEILKIVAVNLFDCCVISSPFYLPVLSFISVNLSIEHGNTANSAYAYEGHGMVMSSNYQDYDAAYEFGVLGKRITEEKLANMRAECKTMNVFWGFLSHLKTHVNLVPDMMQKAYHNGADGGDFVHASYCLVNGHRSLMSMGTNLKEAELITSEYLDNFKKLNADVMHDLCRASSGAFIQYMRGKTISELSFDTEDFGAAKFLEDFSALKLFLVFADIYRMLGFYIMGQDELALEVANQFESNISFAENYIHGEEFRFYASLIYLRMYRSFNAENQQKYWAKIQSYYKFIKKIAISAPINFKNHEYLIAAEIARIERRGIEAIALYDKAIQSASENEHTQYEAIANECAARFWFENKKEDFAAIYMRQAYFCYKLWGADRKVEQIEQRYMQLILPTTSSGSGSDMASTESSYPSVDTTILTKFYNLTSESVLKVSQTISKEITLSGFLINMMNILIENSGALKGILLLERDGVLKVEAEGTSDKSETKVLQSILLDEVNKGGRRGLPISVVNFVSRTQTDVILSDAVTENQFLNDEYILKYRPHSLLCHPIIHHKKLMGILYLENSVTKGLFGEHHLEFLKMLSSQVAISIENALIYQHLEDLVEQRTQELVDAQEQLIQSGKMAALGGLVAGVAHEINTPLGSGITSATLLLDLNKKVQQKYNNNTMRKADLDLYFTNSNKTASLVVDSLTRVDDLVQHFKQIAVDQTDEKHRYFNLKEHLYEVLVRIQHILPLENYKFYFDCKNDVVIDSYPNVFYQIINGLLTNTFIHGYDHGASGEVHLGIQQIDDFIELKYSDKGCGISAENLPVIFDPFFTTNRKSSSVGLGLYIIYILVVKQLNGTIECKSSVGEGTEFTIRFKVERSI